MFIKSSVNVNVRDAALRVPRFSINFYFIRILDNSEITFDVKPANAKQSTFGTLSLIESLYCSCKKKEEKNSS